MVRAKIPPMEYMAPADDLATPLADLSIDRTPPVPPDPVTGLMLPPIQEHVDPLAPPPGDNTPLYRRLY